VLGRVMSYEGARRAKPYSHQLNSMGEAPACHLFPPRAAAPERGGAEGLPSAEKRFFSPFTCLVGALAGGLRPHGAGEGLKIDSFGGLTPLRATPEMRDHASVSLNLIPRGPEGKAPPEKALLPPSTCPASAWIPRKGPRRAGAGRKSGIPVERRVHAADSNMSEKKNARIRQDDAPSSHPASSRPQLQMATDARRGP